MKKRTTTNTQSEPMPEPSPSIAPQKPKRKGLTKSVRFSVFSRDNFACKYCGRQSDEVVLVVDHIVPVCQGGTNDPVNLVTACEDCNSGKGGKTIAQAAPSETDRLRILQEFREQSKINEAAIEIRRRRDELKQEICNYFCSAYGVDSMRRRDLGLLNSFADTYGIETVYHWIDIASSKCSAGSAIRYICGIRRNVDLEMGGENAG